jgi:hypothetical protein
MDVLGYLLADNELVEGQAATAPDPVWLAGRMANLYRHWAGSAGVDLPAITDGFLLRLHCHGEPIAETCLLTARAVERWGGHDYHSAHHHAEVATNAMVITEIARSFGQIVPPEQRALLLAGSLAHDLYYDPHAAGRPRFSAETHSAEALDKIASHCGVRGEERTMLTCLILATEPGFRSTLAKLLNGQEHEGLRPDLDMLSSNPTLASLAGALSDADLLSSAGLTQEWHRTQLDRLQRELGRQITPEEDLQFLDTIVGENFLSPGSKVFSPNLASVREAVRQRRNP